MNAPHGCHTAHETVSWRRQANLVYDGLKYLRQRPSRGHAIMIVRSNGHELMPPEIFEHNPVQLSDADFAHTIPRSDVNTRHDEYRDSGSARNDSRRDDRRARSRSRNRDRSDTNRSRPRDGAHNRSGSGANSVTLTPASRSSASAKKTSTKVKKVSPKKSKKPSTTESEYTDTSSDEE